VTDRPDAFRGAAEYYDRFRPPYPQALIDELRGGAGVTGDGRLLDLACGTGELALRLHPAFREVWAVDLEPEMVEVGRAKAARMDAGNVRWTVGRAEDVTAPPGSFELITVGNAFHRLDRRLIAARALEWLAPGGCLAVANTDSVWARNEPWQPVAVEVIRRWTRTAGPLRPGAAVGRPSPAGNSDRSVLGGNSDRSTPGGHRDRPAPGGPGGRSGGAGGAGGEPRQSHEACLAEAGFARVEEHRFEVGHVWSLDSFIGYLYSTSVVAPVVRAGAAADFEAELRPALLAHDPTGRYPETLRFSCILASADLPTLR
jgi:SAM-dependent methyltransferase